MAIKVTGVVAFLVLAFSFVNIGNCQTDAINKRAMNILKSRKKAGTSFSTLLDSVRRDKEPSLACLAAGILQSSDGISAEQAARIILVARKREDCFHQIVAQAALVSDVPGIVEILLEDPGNEEFNQTAATVLACRAQLAGAGKKRSTKSKKKKKKAKAFSNDFSGPIRQLAKYRDVAVLELALLAAAYSGTDIDEELAAIKKMKRAPGVDGARLLYEAKLGRTLSDEKIAALMKVRVRPNKQFESVSSKLSTYDPTSHPLAYLAQAIGISGEYQYLHVLHKLLKHKDIRVQVEAAKAIGKIGKPESVETLLDVLPKCAWPTKVHVCDALGAIPDKESVPVLIKQLEKESGRFRLDCVYALASIMGEDKGGDASGWQKAWERVEGSFVVDSAKSKKFRSEHKITDVYVQSLGSFYSQQILSDRLVYVVDTSMSMKGVKIADLEHHLSESTLALKDPARFNVVTFGGEIRLGSNRLESAETGTYVSELLQHLELSAPTRTQDAIQMGARFNEADTIYYLSDGAPVSGAIEDWHSIISAYKFFHRYRPMAIFCIEFKAGNQNAAMMKVFSESNYGRSGGVNEPDE